MSGERTIDDLRFTLLQARNPGDAARTDEWRSFSARLGVQPQQVRQVDILAGPLDDRVLEGTDVLLVGGAGEYSLVHPTPAVEGLVSFLTEAVDGPVPIFASCFGFHALSVGLGGEVIADEDHAEVGSYDMELTAGGEADELFGELPREFVAQLGHKDRVGRLPDGVVPLARSARCPYQAFRLPGRAVYATQFHPELDQRDNKLRFKGYMDTYGKLFGAEEALRKLHSHRRSDEVNALMRRFVDHFVLGAGG
jgi:GMP synthase (glutamine-hydrolysing)